MRTRRRSRSRTGLSWSLAICWRKEVEEANGCRQSFQDRRTIGGIRIFRYQAPSERFHRRAIEEFGRFKALRGELPNEPVPESQPESPQPLEPYPNEPVRPMETPLPQPLIGAPRHRGALWAPRHGRPQPILLPNARSRPRRMPLRQPRHLSPRPIPFRPPVPFVFRAPALPVAARWHWGHTALGNASAAGAPLKRFHAARWHWGHTALGNASAARAPVKRFHALFRRRRPQVPALRMAPGDARDGEGARSDGPRDLWELREPAEDKPRTDGS
jgi:hypothetical protein